MRAIVDSIVLINDPDISTYFPSFFYSFSFVFFFENFVASFLGTMIGTRDFFCFFFLKIRHTGLDVGSKLRGKLQGFLKRNST